jgi:DNA-binding LacI/PurR family transcriptional regulator
VVVVAGQAGRRTRLEDVAADAGVSTATASLVLRGLPGPSAESQQRVRDSAARLGYRRDRVASTLAMRRSRLVGVLMDITSPFQAQLVEDVHEALDRSGYDIVLSTVTRSRDEAKAAETLLDSRCEALLLVGPLAPAPALRAIGRRISTIVVGRPIPAEDLDVVRVADDSGVGRLVDHLVGLGHQRISYVEGPAGATSALRRRGYDRAMDAHGLAAHRRVIPGGKTAEHGMAAARTIVDGGAPPSAVLTFNDDCALGLIDGLAGAGVDVPGRISVAGFDDIDYARLSMVGLTTVNQNRAELAELAVAALLERLEQGREEPTEAIVTPRLVVRATTARAPAG